MSPPNRCRLDGGGEPITGGAETPSRYYRTMTQENLRTRIRELIASGALPKDPAPITRPAPTSTPGITKSRILVGGPLHEPCTVCAAPGPQVQYFYIGGQVVRLHAACDALWQLERAGPE